MKAWVAVTDNDWFRHLRSLPSLDEVNFWQPGGQRPFRTLTPGEPFLFKLHAPESFVVGGGFFAISSLLPASLAWEAFGEKNGARSLDEMLRRIAKYRRGGLAPHEDPEVGCILLAQPFFFDEIDWIPVPEGFSPRIVQGKTYDLTSTVGRDLWARVQAVLRIGEPQGIEEDQGALWGDPVLVLPRLGQGSFRVLVTDTYERRCAVTGERALPVLEAAHIRSVAQGGVHRVDNGLLLRSDVHRLYDRGYVTVTPDYKLQVSRRLKEEFDNGDPYYALAGREIWLPRDPRERPRKELLEWHAATVYRG